MLKFSLFCILRGVGCVLVTEVSGKHTASTFKGPVVKKSSWAARLLKVGLIGCAETSVTKHQLRPRNVPEKRRLQLPAAEA
jgi:DMSO/TMAO reductase YedYZ heme-binding membrane subunit